MVTHTHPSPIPQNLYTLHSSSFFIILSSQSPMTLYVYYTHISLHMGLNTLYILCITLYKFHTTPHMYHSTPYIHDTLYPPHCTPQSSYITLHSSHIPPPYITHPPFFCFRHSVSTSEFVRKQEMLKRELCRSWDIKFSFTDVRVSHIKKKKKNILNPHPSPALCADVEGGGGCCLPAVLHGGLHLSWWPQFGCGDEEGLGAGGN